MRRIFKWLFPLQLGMGGMADGYYALDALNPTAQGIGGYEGGFNFHQNAIIGAQKPTGKLCRAESRQTSDLWCPFCNR